MRFFTKSSYLVLEGNKRICSTHKKYSCIQYQTVDVKNTSQSCAIGEKIIVRKRDEREKKLDTCLIENGLVSWY